MGKVDIAIIGGGITGLAAAWELAQHPDRHTIRLFEGSGKPGGKVQSERVGDFLVEAGPDSFVTYKPEAGRLCRQLGLGDQLLATSSTPESVYILRKGRLHPLPAGFRLTAPTRIGAFLRSPLVSPIGKLRMMAEPLISRRQATTDESIGSFVRRRFGDECLERMAGPLMAGIYQADADRLSLAATFPQLHELEARAGSVLLGMRKKPKAKSAPSGPPPPMFQSLRAGMGLLVEVLVSRLNGIIEYNASVERLALVDGKWQVTVNGTIASFDRVICSIAPEQAADLLADTAPPLSLSLNKLRTAPTATVSLGYRRSDVGKPEFLNAYGILAPEVEARAIRSCTWSSIKLTGRAPDDQLLVRAFPTPALLTACPDDDALVAGVRKELENLAGIRGEPIFSRVYRWQYGTPRYEVGHLEQIAAIETAAAQSPGIVFAGCGYRGIGLPDCIAQAAEAVKATLHS